MSEGSNLYRLLKDSFISDPVFVPSDEDIAKYLKSNVKPYYTSVGLYTQDQVNKAIQTKTTTGIHDIVADRLIWDFDNKKDIESARKDTIELVSRIKKTFNAKSENIEVCFSGQKGFSVEVPIRDLIPTNKYKFITLNMSKGLKTVDSSLFVPYFLIRVPTTKHNESGLFKTPITEDELNFLSIDDIKEKAVKKPKWLGRPVVVEVPKEFDNITEEEITTNITNDDIIELKDIRFERRPQGLSRCKYSILQGFFEEGNRTKPLLSLAAELKNLNYDKNIAKKMLESASELQASRYNCKQFTNYEINNIINQVYASSWKGGILSCKVNHDAQKYCEGLGDFSCASQEAEEKKNAPFIKPQDIHERFIDYAQNIEKYTIRTGIPELDGNIRLTIGMAVAILGAASSGKTSVSLNILKNTSKRGINSAFFSFDMWDNLVYAKMINNITGEQISKLLDDGNEDPAAKTIYNNMKKPDKAAYYKKIIEEEFGNVNITSESNLSVDMMKKKIKDYETQSGQKIQLVVVDYMDLIKSEFEDMTASSADIATRLKDMARDLEVCLICLVQPPKAAHGPGSPFNSLYDIKGSSRISEAFRVILSIYREGYSHKDYTQDKFITFRALKNTLGHLFTVDCGWSGAKSRIYSLTETEIMELENLRALKEEQENEKKRR